MAILRDLPYGNQHFLVDLGDGNEGAAAGFSEIVLPDIAIDVIEYRNGNDKESGTHKLPGLARYVTGEPLDDSWREEVKAAVGACIAALPVLDASAEA